MSPEPAPAPYEHPVDVRYLEVDQQGVVFNMWYLAYFDDALTGLFAARGLPYEDMMARGCDVQLVKTELAWRKGVGWGDDLRIRVSCSRIGTTSFVLDFTAVVDGEERVSGQTVYVAIHTDGSGKRRVPDYLRAILEPDLQPS